MAVARSVKRRAEEAEEAFDAFLKEISSKKLTVVLFGSRARGDHTMLSDYDLLIIHEGEDVSSKGLTINATCVRKDEVGKLARSSPVVLSAILEGRILLDNLGIKAALKELKERLLEEGAGSSKERIVLPRARKGP